MTPEHYLLVSIGLAISPLVILFLDPLVEVVTTKRRRWGDSNESTKSSVYTILLLFLVMSALVWHGWHVLAVLYQEGSGWRAMGYGLSGVISLGIQMVLITRQLLIDRVEEGDRVRAYESTTPEEAQRSRRRRKRYRVGVKRYAIPIWGYHTHAVLPRWIVWTVLTGVVGYGAVAVIMEGRW